MGLESSRLGRALKAEIPQKYQIQGEEKEDFRADFRVSEQLSSLRHFLIFPNSQRHEGQQYRGKWKTGFISERGLRATAEKTSQCKQKSRPWIQIQPQIPSPASLSHLFSCLALTAEFLFALIFEDSKVNASPGCLSSGWGVLCFLWTKLRHISFSFAT